MQTKLLLQNVSSVQFRKSISRYDYYRAQNRAIPSQKPEVLFLTSYPPKECGIASYSLDLIKSIQNHFDLDYSCSICAIESKNETHLYSKSPKFILNARDNKSYKKTVFKINKDSNIKMLVIQHEFGFFETHEEDFHVFVKSIKVPIVFVFHTVLPNPNEALRTTVTQMAMSAASIIVMTSHSAQILTEQYQIPHQKIEIISHGTHLIAPGDKVQLKKKYAFENKQVLSTFGLLGSSKNIETTLNALPLILSKHPDVVFLILGKTHPNVFLNEGEKYREFLISKTLELHISEKVVFVNEYLPIFKLLEYLQLTDIYLFTSNDPNQAVSGTFSYALSSGCSVVSTPIPQAKELLGNGNGFIFDFQNATQLANAVIALLDDEPMRDKIKSNGYHYMAQTAWQNSAIAHARVFEKITQLPLSGKFRLPKVNLNHIRNLTDQFGMIQFSEIAQPDISSGYTLDDNARALIALCMNYKLYRKKSDLLLIDTYFQFIKFCFQSDSKFLNYVDEHRNFTIQNTLVNLEDSTGRAIWALGTVISMKEVLPHEMTNEANALMKNALLHIGNTFSTRAMAFMIKGLYYQDHEETQFMLKTLSTRLLKMYQHENAPNWLWFENYLTYANSVIPEALLMASLITRNHEYRMVAKESFDFLMSRLFVDDKIKVISNKGWHFNGRSENFKNGGEQPIDVAYTVLALVKFYRAFNDESYRKKAEIAFSWFMGNNHLNRIIYNPSTGGCYDGLEEHHVNLNQGAESTVCYLMARLSMDELNLIAPK